MQTPEVETPAFDMALVSLALNIPYMQLARARYNEYVPYGSHVDSNNRDFRFSIREFVQIRAYFTLVKAGVDPEAASKAAQTIVHEAVCLFVAPSRIEPAEVFMCLDQQSCIDPLRRRGIVRGFEDMVDFLRTADNLVAVINVDNFALESLEVLESCIEVNRQPYVDLTAIKQQMQSLPAA